MLLRVVYVFGLIFIVSSRRTGKTNTTLELLDASGDDLFSRTSPELSNVAQQVDASDQEQLILLTWNVQNVGRMATQNHLSFVIESLHDFASRYRPGVIALQEIEACSYIEPALPKYSCVDSVVPEHVEKRKPGLVLGGVLLYNNALFIAAETNQILSDLTWKKKMYQHRDRGGKTLSEHHSEECSWAPYNGCRSAHPDIPKTSTVELSLRSGKWSSELLSTLPGGVRVVNVHLFAGGHIKSITEQMRADRRSFQMRALLWLTDIWNSAKRLASPPATFYVGDFNTRGKTEFRKVVASSGDYGVNLWCPADRGNCATVASRHKTHKSGYLDHIAVDLRVRDARKKPNVTALVLPQKGDTWDGHSDHSPLLVQIGPWGLSPTEATPNLLAIACAIGFVLLLVLTCGCLYRMCARAV